MNIDLLVLNSAKQVHCSCLADAQLEQEQSCLLSAWPNSSSVKEGLSQKGLDGGNDEGRTPERATCHDVTIA